MSSANAEIRFALDVDLSHTDHAIVNQLKNGESKTQMRVKTLRGSWPIPSNVQSVLNLLKRIKVVII
jgi:hypothetical protein